MKTIQPAPAITIKMTNAPRAPVAPVAAIATPSVAVAAEMTASVPQRERAGCITNAEKSTSADSCGIAYESAVQCYRAACTQCFRGDASQFEPFSRCQEARSSRTTTATLVSKSVTATPREYAEGR